MTGDQRARILHTKSPLQRGFKKITGLRDSARRQAKPGCRSDMALLVLRRRGGGGVSSPNDPGKARACASLRSPYSPRRFQDAGGE